MPRLYRPYGACGFYGLVVSTKIALLRSWLAILGKFAASHRSSGIVFERYRSRRKSQLRPEAARRAPSPGGESRGEGGLLFRRSMTGNGLSFTQVPNKTDHRANTKRNPNGQ